MANEHPFQNLFESLGRLPLAHAESVNRQAYEVLYDILSVPLEKPGRCVMLRAPRAGHGKTHLLSRIQHHLGATHEFIPLHAAFGSQIDATTVIEDTLRRLLRPLPASGGLCVLDLLVRRLFALALQPLVSSGEVPCQDREGALTALQTRPIETFDFHHPSAVTAHWAKENFEVLGQRLAIELAGRSGLPVREVAFWVDVMFRFAATPVDNPARMRMLVDAVSAGDPPQGIMMERLEALLGMMALLIRVVLVADELEGFSSDQSAALRFAAFLGALRQSVERIDVVLSVNRDVWESAFVPRLSGGLADRLSEVLVELKPLKENEMIDLLDSRVPGLGRKVFDRVNRASAGDHARGLIREAGMAWLRATAADAASPQPSRLEVPSAQPEPETPAAVATPAPAEPQNVAAPPEARVSPVAEPLPPAAAPPEEVRAEVSEPSTSSSGGEAPADWPSPELASQDPEPSAGETVGSTTFAEPVGDEDSGFTATPAQSPDFQATGEPSPFAAAPAGPTGPTGPEDIPQPAPEAGSAAPDGIPGREEPPAAPEPPAEETISSPYGTSSAPSLTPAGPEPAPASPTEPAEEEAADVPPPGDAESETIPDTDRVDELLRKFRERYGRGGS